MQRKTIYKLYVDIKPEADSFETEWFLVGTFRDNTDAEYAAKLYMAAHNNTPANIRIGCSCTGMHKVDKMLSSIRPNYINLNAFIKSNRVVKSYGRKIGEDGMKRLLESVEHKIIEERNFRIIDRMIRDYQYQIMLDEKNPQNRDIAEDHKENIKFLQELRDGKVEFGK